MQSAGKHRVALQRAIGQRIRGSKHEIQRKLGGRGDVLSRWAHCLPTQFLRARSHLLHRQCVSGEESTNAFYDIPKIEQDRNSFQIAVNGEHFCAFAYRMPLEDVTSVEINGSLEDTKFRQLELFVYPDPKLCRPSTSLSLSIDRPLVEWLVGFLFTFALQLNRCLIRFF